MAATVETVGNGREDSGRFGPGNQFARGRSGRAAELRRAMMEAVSEDDVAEVVGAVVRAAKEGDVAAAKLFFDRVLGKVSVAQDDTGELQDEGRNRILQMIQGDPDGKS